jgi:hypothetical protein
LSGCVQLTDAAKETVHHSLPNIDLRIDARGDSALNVAHGVIQQNFVIADMDADRRQAGEVAIER